MKWISGAALALLALAGCQDSDPAHPAPGDSHAGASTTQAGSRPTEDRSAASAAPELMLISVRDETVIAVVDFNSVRGKIAALSLSERRRYVLQHCFDCYLAERSDKHRQLKNVRIYAMFIPDRDDYARGNYVNVTTLGLLNSTQDLVADAAKTLEARAGKLEWKSDLMNK